MDWTQLKKYHRTIVSTILSRKPEVAAAYQKHVQTLTEQGLSTTDYLLNKIFGRSDVSTSSDQVNLTGVPHTSLWRLTRNKYPYDLSPEIDHLIFWIHPQITLTPAQVEQALQEELCRFGYSNQEFIYFQNTTARRSVPGIEHYQVFVRR